ncbi:MAG TPA: DUF2959 family protein [Verrucomicrobiae bacterium]
MKISANLKIIATQLALVVALTLFAGCMSKSYDKGMATSKALQSSADAVGATSQSLYGVLGAMDKLTFKSQGDLRDQLDAFKAASKGLDKSMDKLGESVAALHAKADAYFADWTNHTAMIQSADLRQRSLERKAEVSGKLADVTASYDKLKMAVHPFTIDVKDIETYLDTDLTTGGIATIKDIVTKTKVDAVPLRAAIKQLQTSFSNLSTTLSPVLPTPPAK